MAKGMKTRRPRTTEPPAITEIRVGGFKSIAEEQAVEIRPLTILAGANSSGKSSAMQPVLLLKQTLEVPYDAGPILLNGPNVKFTSANQLLSHLGKGRSLDSFQIGLKLNTGAWFRTRFRKEHKTGFGIDKLEIAGVNGPVVYWPGMSEAEIRKTGTARDWEIPKTVPEGFTEGHWQISRERCFIGPEWVAKGQGSVTFIAGGRPGPVWENIISQVIHVPGLRGNPERAYSVGAVGQTFPGTFDKYTASVIAQWVTDRQDLIGQLDDDLQLLGLTGAVRASRINDVQVEITVGRLPGVSPAQPDDRINVADVGIGVSQVLPALTALLIAQSGQLVYLEQPEIHLHPKAQVALARVLANASNRSVRVIAETHSSLLLLGIQALVAGGQLAPEKVKLHWFQRDKMGHTAIRSGDLDGAGRYGEWPEDFDNVSLHAEKDYLDAAERRLFAQ